MVEDVHNVRKNDILMSWYTVYGRLRFAEYKQVSRENVKPDGNIFFVKYNIISTTKDFYFERCEKSGIARIIPNSE